MPLTSLYGTPFGLIGPGAGTLQTVPVVTSGTMDAANEAVFFIGHVLTSDGASHTLDTSGSSSLGWRTGATTFANGATTVKVGLAAVDTANGPPARPVNVADVVTFDVSKSLTGGGGGITTAAWQTHVPDTGTKTIANGDLVAFVVQMTARGGADSVIAQASSGHTTHHRPVVSQFAGGAYAQGFGGTGGMPNAIITFSDGAIGYFQGSEVFSTISTRTWNSADATKEYGQLYKLPFPTKIYGLYGWADPDADFDVVLYSDPLGTPVSEKTVSIDANTVAAVSGRRFFVSFATPYTTTADQLIGAVYKPGGSNISAYFRTLASATHRVADVWGEQGYGISRDTGVFADANSSLDHYYIGLIAGAFSDGAGGLFAGGMSFSDNRVDRVRIVSS